MPLTQRAQKIEEAIAHAVTEHDERLFVSPIEQDAWGQLPNPGQWHGLGWRPAMKVTRDGADVMATPFCPELIDKQTDQLDDTQLRQYLLAIAFMMAHTAVAMVDIDPADPDAIAQAIWKVEAELDEQNDKALVLVFDTYGNYLSKESTP